MKLNKNFKLGEYVLLSKYSDYDPQDPWEIGFIQTLTFDDDGVVFAKAKGRFYGYAKRISKEFGRDWMKEFCK